MAFLSRLGIAVGLGLYKEPSRVETQKIAMSVAAGTGYGNPYKTASGPTAHNAPLYPLLLAGVFGILGAGQRGELGMYVLNTLAVSGVYALLPLVALAMHLPVRLGLTSSMLGILVPVHFLIELRGGEYGFCALFLVILFLATARLWRLNAFTLMNGILHGVAWGIALLLSPALLPVGIAWLAAAFWHYRKQVIVFGTTLSLITVSVLVPWAARNKAVLGHAVFLRSNFGLELQISNNDLARATIADNIRAGTYRAYHPFTSSSESELVRRLGEVDYNRQKLDEALQWIRANYRAFTELTLARIVLFWFPKTTRWWQSTVLWILTLLAFAGWSSVRGSHRVGLVLVQVVWLVYPAVYYVLQTDSRYRYPLHWTLLLLAAIPVEGMRRYLFVNIRASEEVMGSLRSSRLWPKRFVKCVTGRHFQAAEFAEAEPPRLFRRLRDSKGWSYGKSSQVSSGGRGEGGPAGLRAAGGTRVAMGGEQLDRRQDGLCGREASDVGEAGRARGEQAAGADDVRAWAAQGSRTRKS